VNEEFEMYSCRPIQVQCQRKPICFVPS